jgi:16S rRNA (cytosine967-C5)-methyltransferase
MSFRADLKISARESAIKNKKLQTARSQAIACLAAWSGTGKPAQGFVDALIHNSCLSNEDRQLAVMLVIGALRRQGSLDWLISRFAKTALSKMRPMTLAALRIGVLQLCVLERIPEAAAVNETVAALKLMRQPLWLLGFVNGILRNIARQKDSLPRLDALAPEIDHPAWLTERWRRSFGENQAQAVCRINSMEPQLCLNSLRCGRDELARRLEVGGISAVPGRYAPNSLLLPEWRRAVTTLPGFAEGLFQVQDQAAQLACRLLGPFKEQHRCLDGCAGLGGKTCALAACLPAGAALTAVEPDTRRSRLLQENLTRQQAQDRVSIFSGTLDAFAATQPQPFDGILIDAPCSGTGVIRRQPDIRWNRQPDDVLLYQKQQLALLRTAATLLAPGGTLVYATCSIEPEENWQVIERFLAENSGYELTGCQTLLPDAAAMLTDGRGCFAPLPDKEIDGFFAARMVKKAG